MTLDEVFQIRCQDKTDKQNVYETKQEAKVAASKLSRKSGKKINSFRCPTCRRWHIGKRSKRMKNEVVVLVIKEGER